MCDQTSKMNVTKLCGNSIIIKKLRDCLSTVLCTFLLPIYCTQTVVFFWTGCSVDFFPESLPKACDNCDYKHTIYISMS